MTTWTVDTPREMTFDHVSRLDVRIAGGSVDVVATAGQPRLEIAAIEGPPITIEQDEGTLTVGYADTRGGAGGILRWLRPFERRHLTIALAVPASCQTHVSVVSATAVISGMSADTAVRSATGSVTLDGLSGAVSVRTVSGAVEARGLDGTLGLGTVSGDLTVASGQSGRVQARTVSGRLTIDLDLAREGRIQLDSVSGDVAVRLPETAGVTVDLRSVTGQLGAAFEGLTRRRRPGRITAYGRVGRGSGRLSASTVSGDIALLSRPVGRPTADRGREPA